MNQKIDKYQIDPYNNVFMDMFQKNVEVVLIYDDRVGPRL